MFKMFTNFGIILINIQGVFEDEAFLVTRGTIHYS
jgi:hypothetical protein